MALLLSSQWLLHSQDCAVALFLPHKVGRWDASWHNEYVICWWLLFHRRGEGRKAGMAHDAVVLIYWRARAQKRDAMEKEMDT